MRNENYPYDIKHRITSKSVIRENGCVEYRGDNPPKHKYGLVSITVDGKRKTVPVHRAMWMAVNDRFDLSHLTVIHHTCDNPRCVNIGHLVPGTHKDNSDDMFSRGRQRKKETYKLHTRQCVFTDDQILAIKNATGKLKWIAEEFGVSPGYVSKLKSGKAKTLIV